MQKICKRQTNKDDNINIIQLSHLFREMCPVLHWCILFFWIPWTLFCLSCPFFSLMCNFNVANSKKNSYRKTRYLFCYKPKYKRSRSPFISKVFLFHFCHHAVNMYGTMPLTLTVWLYSDTIKKTLNALGLVRRTKTSVHKIVNVCLQYLSSLFFS